MIIVLSKIVFNQVYASSVRTNINEVTTYLNNNIDNRNSFESNIESQKLDILNQIYNNQGLEYISDNPSSIISDNSILINTNPHDLESLGRHKVAQEIANDNFNPDIFIDYIHPSNIAHKKDIDEFTSHTSKFMSNFLDNLKNLGIICKEVSNREINTTFSIKASKESQKDTKYNQFFCEELKNRYTCRDTLITKCTKTAIRYKDWQEFEIELDGIDSANRGWIDFSIRWGKRKAAGHLFTKPHVVKSITQYLSNLFNVDLDQIKIEKLPGRGKYEPIRYCPRSMIWPVYVVKYFYRETYEICETWSDSWLENCKPY